MRPGMACQCVSTSIRHSRGHTFQSGYDLVQTAGRLLIACTPAYGYCLYPGAWFVCSSIAYGPVARDAIPILVENNSGRWLSGLARYSNRCALNRRFLQYPTAGATSPHCCSRAHLKFSQSSFMALDPSKNSFPKRRLAVLMLPIV